MVLRQVFHNVLLFNGSDLTFSLPPSSPLDMTTAAIASIGGDNTGSLKVKSGDLVFLGSNLSVVPSLDTTTVVRTTLAKLLWPPASSYRHFVLPDCSQPCSLLVYRRAVLSR